MIRISGVKQDYVIGIIQNAGAARNTNHPADR